MFPYYPILLQLRWCQPWPLEAFWVGLCVPLAWPMLLISEHLFSGITRCCRFILYFSCHGLKISPFSKGCWFLYSNMALRNQGLQPQVLGLGLSLPLQHPMVVQHTSQSLQRERRNWVLYAASPVTLQGTDHESLFVPWAERIKL